MALVELKRNIYYDLLRWKQRDSGKVLELKGSRQTGKTFILDKFARDNYKVYIYINMAQLSGEQFLACMEQASAWKPGEPRIEKALQEAIRLFDSRFEDNKDTIIVIDEIQESAKVYSKIRGFSRDFVCHFIVAGSYLGKTLEKGYFLSAGDTENLILNTLSFEEFVEAFGKRKLYNDVDLLGSSNPEQYDELKEYYKIYCEIGGYPDVINCYMETQDTQECKKVLTQIIRTFIEESKRYLGGIQEMILLEQIFPAIAQLSAREKKEHGDLITELSRIIYNGKSNRTMKKSICAVIDWLYRSDIIGYCDKANECDPVNVSLYNRLNFQDVGVCRYFLDAAGADLPALREMISKNFVYIELLKRIRGFEITGIAPMFGTYKDGEIDFLIKRWKNDNSYGVEVEAEKSETDTVQQLLKNEKVEAVYFLKGDTYGGMAVRKITVPIYLVGRVRFDYERENEEKS
ncbi:ATP-binding protein [Lacrimispora celerecrescens]|uniref:ATP-binding protein n=1 Tax=Lacrimispora celerecrescens TaxID=29354 RepID=UPI001FA92488